MADHGLDGSSATHLAADGLGDTPDLSGDPDLEPIRVVVTAIALVAVDAADLSACCWYCKSICADGPRTMH
jgi:hypothetical protein